MSHNHSSHYVIGFMVEGQIRLENGMKTQMLKTQDTFVIEPDQRHSIRTVEPFSLVTFSIENTFFKSHSVEEAKIIVQEMKQQVKSSDLLMKVDMNLILNHINAIYQFQNTNPVISKSRQLDHVKALICEHATEPLSLDDLAKSAFLSKFHFVKKFSGEFGLTPHNLKIQRQIRLAQRQLLEPKTISEVAVNVGFFDQSHFTKHFRKILKLTPKEYRHSYEALEVVPSKPKRE